MNLHDAARSVGVHETALYYWVKRRPELFVRGTTGWTITAENLALLRFKPKPPAAPVPPPVLKRAAPRAPATMAPPSMRQGERQVGWYCRRCEACVPINNRFCRCLDGAESMRKVNAFRAEQWVPTFVRLMARLGGR